MATARSTLPARLRQLISGENSIGPSVKLDSEPVSFFFLNLSPVILFCFIFC